MIANKTSFNSQSASDAGKKSGEVRRQNKRIREAYRHAFSDHADDMVKDFMNGSNELLGIKIPQDMRGRIAEQVLTQTIVAELTTAIKHRSELDLLLAKCDAKALESMPPESDDGSEYMTTSELMQREGTQSEADSAKDVETQTFGYWYNELEDDIKSDVMSEYFHNSLNELFDYCDKPADEVIKQFNIKIGV